MCFKLYLIIQKFKDRVEREKKVWKGPTRRDQQGFKWEGLLEILVYEGEIRLKHVRHPLGRAQTNSVDKFRVWAAERMPSDIPEVEGGTKWQTGWITIDSPFSREFD